MRSIVIGISGDSIAFGYDGTNAHGNNRLLRPFSVQLVSILNSVYYPISFRLAPIDLGGFVNTGVNSRQLQNILISELEVFRPDIIFQNAVTNDISLGASDTDVTGYATTYRLAAKARGIRTIFGDCLPGGYTTTKEAFRLAYNSALYAGSQDDPGWSTHVNFNATALGPTNTALTNTDNYQPSDIHPTEHNVANSNGGGNEIMANTIVPAIRAISQFIR